MVRLIENDQSFEEKYNYDWFSNKVISQAQRDHQWFSDALRDDNVEAHEDVYEYYEKFLKEMKKDDYKSDADDVAWDFVEKCIDEYADDFEEYISTNDDDNPPDSDRSLGLSRKD